MKYRVAIIETLSRVVEVEAESERDALDDVWGSYNSCDIVLGWEDFIGVDFEIREADDD